MTAPALATLYQSLVLEHNRRPRHSGAIAAATHHARGANPLCGDQLELWLRLDDDCIAGIGHQIEASALTRAMSSMMTDQVYGLSESAARRLAQDMLADCKPDGHLDRTRVGELAAWQAVLAYPNRIKSLTLPWATLLAALDGHALASTESP